MKRMSQWRKTWAHNATAAGEIALWVKYSIWLLNFTCIISETSIEENSELNYEIGHCSG